MATPYYSISNYITWGNASQSLSYRGEQKSQAFNGLTASKDLDQKLYCARKSLEWEYAQNSSSELLYELADYVYALSFPYVLEAQQITVDGGLVVIPTTPTSGTSSNIAFYVVKGGDFTNATDYTNSDLVGKDISVFLQNYNRYLEDDEYVLLAGGIVRIFGFDSTAYTVGKIIMRVDVNGTAPISNIVDAFAYDLTEITTITGIAAGVNNQTRRFIIRPNGFSYVWDSNYFEFTDNWPEQPDATGVGTIQIYDFMYDSGTGKNICVNQSLNATI